MSAGLFHFREVLLIFTQPVYWLPLHILLEHSIKPEVGLLFLCLVIVGRTAMCSFYCCCCCTDAPTLSAVSESKPFQNLFYAVELPGVFKAIFLTSYSPGQTFSKDEEQYVWLQQELKQVFSLATMYIGGLLESCVSPNACASSSITLTDCCKFTAGRWAPHRFVITIIPITLFAVRTII